MCQNRLNGRKRIHNEYHPRRAHCMGGVICAVFCGERGIYINFDGNRRGGDLFCYYPCHGKSTGYDDNICLFCDSFTTFSTSGGLK